MGGGSTDALGKLGVALSILFGIFLIVLLLEVLFLHFRGKSKPLRQQVERELHGHHHHHHQSHGPQSPPPPSPPPPSPPPPLRRQRKRQQWRWRKQRREQREQNRPIDTNNPLGRDPESVHMDTIAASRHHFSREAALVGSFGGYPSSFSSSSNANPPFLSSSSSASSSSAYPSSHSISSMSTLFPPDSSSQFSPLHGALSSIAEETGEEVDLPHSPSCIPTGLNPNHPRAASACPNTRRGFANPNVYTARSSIPDMLYLARSHNPSASNGLPNADQSSTEPDSRINANLRRESDNPNPTACRDGLEMYGSPNLSSQAVGSPNLSSQALGSPNLSSQALGSPNLSSQAVGSPVSDGGGGGGRRSPSADVTVTVTPFTTPPSSPPPTSSATSSPVTAASHFSAVSVSPGSSVPGSPMLPPRLSSACSNGSVSVSGSCSGSVSVSVSGSTATSRFSPCDSPVLALDNHQQHGPLGALFRRTYNITASPSSSRPHPHPHRSPFRPAHYPASSVVVDFRRALPFSPPNSAAWNNNVS